MKEFLIAFIIVLIFSCTFGGYQGTSFAMPITIRPMNVVEHTPDVAEMGAGQIGELKMVDSDFEPLAVTEVKKSGPRNANIRFPAFGRFE